MHRRGAPGWRRLGLFLCICVLCQHALQLWHLSEDAHFFFPADHADVPHAQAPLDGHASDTTQASLTIRDDASCQRFQPPRDIHHPPHPRAEHQDTGMISTKTLRVFLSMCPLLLVATADMGHVGVVTRYQLAQKPPPPLPLSYSRIALRAPPALV